VVKGFNVSVIAGEPAARWIVAWKFQFVWKSSD
jgi:hypothetical protein